MTLVKESATVLGGKPLSAETISNILTHQLRDGRPHPLAQLSAAEIEQVAAAFRAEHHGKTLRFKWISLLEPPKRLLKLFLAADRQGDKSLPSVPRLADVVYYVVEDKQFFQAHYNVSLRQLIKSEVVPEEFKPPGDPFEIVELEQILLRDAKFQHALKQFKLPAGAILAVDPWIYGSDTRDPIERLVTFMVYIRNPKNNHPDSNHYSFPIPLYPVMSTATKEVLHIWDGCTGGPEDGMKTHTWDSEDPMGHLEGNEYLHELLDEPLRSDLKPLLVSQPEGPSFSIDGNKIYWQKWTFIISFNMREGLVFHDIYYDGRSVFYRLSMAEMTVPYGDPRPPYHRKQAFDAGDAGLGFCANELDLGCDCLGVIKYFSAVFARPDGSARVAKNVVCMHEVDDGILSKHTNYRTNVASVIRSRQLVFQIICTVSNYEYIWLWKFDQAGAIHHEMRATGILSTQYIDKGKLSPYGNIVSPGVLAANHQHLFSLRVDPAIEGHANSVSIEDSVRMPAGPDNPFLTGWNVEKTIMKESGWVDAAPEKSRVFKIVNKDKINPVSKRPMGYKLVPHPSQLMLAHEGSVAHDRAQYAGHHLWVTQYRDDELYPSGYWTNQSSGNAGGVQSMVARKDNVEQDDIVLWSTYALTHNPRVEDFPVMPYEQLVISLKPADFFTKNPALDVPPSDPRFNRSVAYEDAIRGMGEMRLRNGSAHDRCCS